MKSHYFKNANEYYFKGLLCNFTWTSRVPELNPHFIN